jgi:uncharacterized protein YgiM (DUF1202 family)
MHKGFKQLVFAGVMVVGTLLATQTQTEAKKKDVAVAVVDSYLNIRAEATTSSESIGRLYNGGGGKVLKTGKEWTKIKSGTVTGYVSNDYILTGKKALQYLEKHNDKIATVTASSLNIRSKMSISGSDVLRVAERGESLKVAKEYEQWAKVKISPMANGFVAKDYVDIEFEMDEAVAIEKEPETVIPKVDENTSETRKKLVKFACKHIGNPYVYGGTSLTEGADCSGFAMKVYENFGYSIGRSTYDQIEDGRKIKVAEAKPGDLIFYGDAKAPGHVAIYIGNGQVVHASTSSTGIIISSMDYREPCAARRIIED